MKLSDAKILAELLMERYLHPQWKFEWHDMKSAIGTCHYDSFVIKLSRYFVPKMTEDEVEQTLLHEIAHALTPGHGHDRRWKMVAKSLGLRDPKSTLKLSGNFRDYYKYAIVFDKENGEREIIKGYFKRPSRKVRETLDRRWIKGRPETKGKLKVISMES